VSGWFIVDTRELPWFENDGHGAYVVYEPPGERFEQLGIGLGISGPASPAPVTTARTHRRTSWCCPGSACS
jgi:hypothetical protein